MLECALVYEATDTRAAIFTLLCGVSQVHPYKPQLARIAAEVLGWVTEGMPCTVAVSPVPGQRSAFA
jgi:hypothetical protein